jgi:hypothetical protein
MGGRISEPEVFEIELARHPKRKQQTAAFSVIISATVKPIAT